MTAYVVPDKEGLFRQLKENKKDLPFQDYLVRLSKVMPLELADRSARFPEVMTNEQAAEYLQLSPNTLYNIRDKPRLRHNRY